MGLLYRGAFRRLLDQLKFRGYLTDYMETKTWTHSYFVLKGMSDMAALNVRNFVIRIQAAQFERDYEKARVKAAEQAKEEADRLASELWWKENQIWVYAGMTALAGLLGVGLYVM